jgi:MYXO-CTERM domain-containing protein
MRLAKLAGCSTALALCLASFESHAIQPMASHPAAPAIELRTLDGAPRSASPRGVPVWEETPRHLKPAYDAFRAELGLGWRASFDGLRGAPSRLYGPGLAAPGAVSDPALALDAAKGLLARHVDLLAPGASASDFVLVSNDLDADLRTIGFRQTRGGLAVDGGQVSFRFKNDRLFVIGTEAFAYVPDLSALPELPVETLEKAARSWVEEDFGEAVVTAVGEARVVPFRDAGGRLRYAKARFVDVAATHDTAKLRVAVDVTTGQPILRTSLLHFASAPVLLRVPMRSPSFGERADLPTILANANVENGATASNVSGEISWTTGTTTDVELFLTGERVRIFNDAGPEATLLATLTDSTPYVWDGSSDTQLDAQLTTFIHAERVRTFAKTFAPNLAFLNNQVHATVNIADQCNAFSDGTTINFFSIGGGCENTGRIADVVFHEYGHSLHYHAVIEGVGAFEGALSEGISDYLAATITGDPATARGFFLSSDELRHLDPPGQENRWPDDVVGEVHYDGLIIGQTLWDLRKNLVETLGSIEGPAQANVLFYQGIRRAVDIPSMYVEVLAADDDDGDLTNGTPNVCAINAAFDLHGLRAISAKANTLAAVAPSVSGYEVSVEITGLFPECDGDTVLGGTLTYRPRNGGIDKSVAMTLEGTTVRGTIPEVPANTVVNYRVEVELDGRTVRYPDNAADPDYEMFVGTVEPLYCTDFETDPELDGWTHGLLEGEDVEGADDWVWAEPKGTAVNGDPPSAFSGERAFGNDLSIEDNYNGLYQPDRKNFASSPMIDLKGYTKVHLQYRRWLNVEDGQFDRASILVGEVPVWQNLDSDMGNDSKIHHRDREWRFHDVDLTAELAGRTQAQVHFLIESDQGLEFGGWTLDDFCVVGLKETATDPCADGEGGGCAGAGGAAPEGGGGATGEPSDELEPSGGCDCRAASQSSPGWAWLPLAGALAAFARRRRKPD